MRGISSDLEQYRTRIRRGDRSALTAFQARFGAMLARIVRHELSARGSLPIIERIAMATRRDLSASAGPESRDNALVERIVSDVAAALLCVPPRRQAPAGIDEGSFRRLVLLLKQACDSTDTQVQERTVRTW